ncbi:hypothetical protein EPA93_08635 [Ktedonosporobacter rubrisoli]|uniref:Bacteriocin n=1 Tax=Ktedonosporobacter rubrisoli TaxID=2509675 RepID=A0A4P6JLH9_KTERU|nr:hypothetical protein [Ktedonosporobacter rubrisoli]QBD76068.1 hypothetical protein EPA93_08635 [Ktedonosporobacter rubrisoli]
MMYELNEQELEMVAGGKGHKKAAADPINGNGKTDLGIDINGSAKGGLLGKDLVFTKIIGQDINVMGESVKFVVGVGISEAI